MSETHGEPGKEAPPGESLVSLMIEEHRKEVDALNQLILRLCERIHRQGELIATYARKGKWVSNG